MSSGNLSDDFVARLRILLAPLRRNRMMWLETVVITLSVVAAGMFFQHDNPFQIGGEFHWIWFAPVLIALRYGVAPGFVSSLLLITAWKVLDYLSAARESFPEQFFLGGLILVMVCGEFSAAWNARLRRAEETNHYLDERLSRITLRHLLLRLSHDRMEQEILTKPVTLRDALSGLRRLTSAQSDSQLPAAPALLQLLTQYCQLESAAIFVISAAGKYVLASAVGSPPALLGSDPLLHYALEHQSLSHLLVEGMADTEQPSPFLVVAPILTSGGESLGVLAIDRMPFLALNDENLQMLSVMLGYYADCVNEAEGTRRFKDIFPEAPADFAAEFSRLLRLQRTFSINSYIVMLSFENDDSGRQAIANLTHIRRGLDISWQTSVANRILLANLMPLANESAVEGYLIRIETLMKEYMGLDYDEWRLTPVRISLAESDPLASLQHVLADRHD